MFYCPSYRVLQIPCRMCLFRFDYRSHRPLRNWHRLRCASVEQVVFLFSLTQKANSLCFYIRFINKKQSYRISSYKAICIYARIYSFHFDVEHSIDSYSVGSTSLCKLHKGRQTLQIHANRWWNRSAHAQLEFRYRSNSVLFAMKTSMYLSQIMIWSCMWLAKREICLKSCFSCK